MEAVPESHSAMALMEWDSLNQKINPRAKSIVINGHDLDLATVVAVARHGASTSIDLGTLFKVKESEVALETSLARGATVYGVNTGFGGSADTRTQRTGELQATLTRELNCGILADPTIKSPIIGDSPDQARAAESASTNGYHSTPLDRIVLPLDDPVAATCMPEAWVRAATLIRINSLAHGHSGVRPVLVERMLGLLTEDIVPRVPLRGSISASGDLSPLSYIAGALQGKPSITVWAGDRHAGRRRIVTAKVALAEASINPIKLIAKEGLAIVNGTAFSAAVGALALHEAHHLAVLSQVLTAMSVEALHGAGESFDPFFAAVRPHPGQIESSRNIFSFLGGSRLINRDDHLEAGSLVQDRYSLRTASQWIGPLLEDLLLAHRQMTTECNSVTDNPLIDTETARILQGGNFQAKAVTSAMEKTRLALQSIGRMLFVQCTELIDPTLSRGLPPNLVADEPSESFLMKGMDIMTAALQSELGFLSNPVGSHVQTAEMGNQALNSLALISARYTHVALDVLSQLASAHLFALCQALDLRVMHLRFLEALHPAFRQATIESLGIFLGKGETINKLVTELWAQFNKRLDQTTTMDSGSRFAHATRSLQPFILEFTSSCSPPPPELIPALKTWTDRCSAIALETFNLNREYYFNHPDAKPFLGTASQRMYHFVRVVLKVPFLRAENIRTPCSGSLSFDTDGVQPNGMSVSGTSPTVGSYMTSIHGAVRSGALYAPVMECLRDVK